MFLNTFQDAQCMVLLDNNRAWLAMKTAEVETLGELVSFNKSDLLKFRNFGKKSLTELEEMVLVKGLNFGMDIAKFNLDKE